MLHLVTDTCRDRFITFAHHGSRSADLLLGGGPGFDEVASISVLVDLNPSCLSVIDYLSLGPLFLIELGRLINLIVLKLR